MSTPGKQRCGIRYSSKLIVLLTIGVPAKLKPTEFLEQTAYSGRFILIKFVKSVAMVTRYDVISRLILGHIEMNRET